MNYLQFFTFKGNTGVEGLCDDSNCRPSDEARVSEADCVHTCSVEFDGLQLWQSKKYSPEIPSYVHHSSHMERMTATREKKMVIRRNMMGLLFRKYEVYVLKQRHPNPIV